MPQSSAISCTVILFSFFSQSNFFKDAEIARLVISLMIFSPVRRRVSRGAAPFNIQRRKYTIFFIKSQAPEEPSYSPFFRLSSAAPRLPCMPRPARIRKKTAKQTCPFRRIIAINRTYFVFFRRKRLTFRAVSYKIIFV